jgi:Flp pilus assembly protein TadD
VSTHTRIVFIFIALAGVSWGQSFSNEAFPKDASNTEMFTPKPNEIRGAGLRGSVSVQELQRPLEGKGLRMILKAKELIAKGDLARALEQMRAALREPSAEPYALAMLGTEHIRQGDLNSAIAELQAALRLMPGVAATQSNLALALAAQHRTEEALVHARKALQLDPARAKTRFVIGMILLEMRHDEEAEFHLKIAAKELPGAQSLLEKYLTPAVQ